MSEGGTASPRRPQISGTMMTDCRISTGEGNGPHVHGLRGDPEGGGRDHCRHQSPGNRCRHRTFNMIAFRNR